MTDQPLTIRAAEYTRMTALAQWNAHARDCRTCLCSADGRGLEPRCRAGRTLVRRYAEHDAALRAALALRQSQGMLDGAI